MSGVAVTIRRMRVTLIGGTAFMGPVVVRQLLEAGHEVTIFHRGKTSAAFPAGVKVIKGDRQQLGSQMLALRATQPDVVVDMICMTRADAKDLVSVFSGIARRAVVASSCDVYRNFGGLIGVETEAPTGGKLTESSALRSGRYPFRPQATGPGDVMYNYDKLDVEEELRSAPLASCILRLPMVYGEGDRQRRLSGYLKKLKAGAKTITLGATHSAWRSNRGFVDNMASAIAAAILKDTSAGKTYNVADATALTEKEFVEEVIRASGFAAEVSVVADDAVPAESRFPGDARYHMEIDSSRIRAELGHADVVATPAAIARAAKWELATLQ
jgi:nucleoside-diphosphate-sugar epimerase